MAHRNRCKQEHEDMLIYLEIRKYGIENFTINVLEECKPQEKYNREKYWIKKMNTKIPNGYNGTDGGQGGYGRIVSDSEKAILIKRNKEREWMLDAREWRSNFGKKMWSDPAYYEGHSGKNHHNYGIKRTEDAINKIKEYYKHNLPWGTRRVNLIDIKTGDVSLCFISLKNAGTWVGAKGASVKSQSTLISNVCKNRRETAYGYKWEYNNEGN